MWPPYFCSISPWPYSEIHVYIPHKRVNRLNFSFGHSVFSLLMVNSKGGSSNILILFSGVKSTSKFSTLTSKAVVGCFLPFSKIGFSGLHWCYMAITYTQRLRYRGGGLWNIICQNFVKDRQIFVVLFNPVFRFFVNT